MKQKEPEKALQTDSELDAALAQMAEEAPPMPAEFHEQWMNAIRAEAKETGPSAEENLQNHPVSLIRWTRILSVAAAFIFLIGGTVLYRNSKKTLSTAPRAAEKTDLMMAAEAPAAGEETEAAVAEEGAIPEENAAKNAATEEADMAEAGTDYDTVPALFMNAVEDAEDEDAYDAAPKAVSGSMAMLSAEKSYEAAEEGFSAAAGDAPEAYEEAESFAVPEIPQATPLPTALPAVPADETEKAEAPKESADDAETGFLQNIGAFLTDMGDFLLAALPYLAVLAVPAVIALVIRRRKRQSA